MTQKWGNKQACFLRVNPPYCIQITWKTQAQNMHIKKCMQKYMKKYVQLWKLSVKSYWNLWNNERRSVAFKSYFEYQSYYGEK